MFYPQYFHNKSQVVNIVKMLQTQHFTKIIVLE